MNRKHKKYRRAGSPLRAPLTPLVDEPRATLPTNEAAQHLGRQPQTLRDWACHEDGPIRPTRIHGRLHWSVAQIRQLVGA